MYFELKDKLDDAHAEIKQLKVDNADLKQYFSGIVEAQAAQITELQTMVFGRKNRPRSGGGHTAPKPPRDAASYHRPKPNENKVPSEEHYPFDVCHHCGGSLTNKEEYTRYVEDIILTALSVASKFKTVQKHTIERGYCIRRGKYSSAKDL